MEKEKSYPDYVGKKIKGFKFEANGFVDWLEYKSEFVGQIGEITFQAKNWVQVRLPYDVCYYPIELVEQHLVEEEPQLPKRN